MKVLEASIIILSIVGLGTVVILFWVLISNVLDGIKRLIRSLKRKCPSCYERVREKDNYCWCCGYELFEKEENDL